MVEKRRKSVLANVLKLLFFILLVGVIGCGSDSDDDDDIINPPESGVFTDWEGDWVSHSVYMDEADAQAGFETMALQKSGYTADDVETVVKQAYYTDFGRLVVDDDSITFYSMDRTTEICSCTYEDNGDGTMSGESARKFELSADTSDACQDYKYLIMQPLAHHESGEEHLHIRYGTTGFDDLMEGDDNMNWWPILTRSSSTTSTYVSEYMLEFTEFYLSLLPDLPEKGTVVFEANGEDFVREGFVSEDGWRIDFSAVYVNLSTPAVYQTESDTPSTKVTRHAGHDDGETGQTISDAGTNRVPLSGSYFLNLKQDTFEVGRNDQATAGTYSYLDFTIDRADSNSQGFDAAYEGYSIVLLGTATKEGEDDVNFTIKFDEIMQFMACGPLDEVLAADGSISAEMTFHFDHIFGDYEEGPADTTDEDTVNYLAIGFQPFADLASEGVLDISQGDMVTAGMSEAIYEQLMGAVRTLGHTGESHCDCIQAESGTVIFEANGEDFVREGFVSEDAWQIDFSAVYVNLSMPAVYQTDATTSPTKVTRHAGHDDDTGQSISDAGTNRASLSGSYFLNLKQDTFEVGRNDQATAGTYSYLDFTIDRADSTSQGVDAAYEGYSIVLLGTATKDGEDDVNFTIKFDEIMQFMACGPLDEVLAADGSISAEMTFHFDHIFGDYEEGPADTTDEDTVNYLAIGFQPFADLAAEGVLDISQGEMVSAGMSEAIYEQLMGAVRTLGHTGESHCHCVQE